MNKITKNEQGFSVIELVLAVVIIILVGVVSWLVYKDGHKKATVTTNSSTTKTGPVISTSTKSTDKTLATPSPYAGWKTGTLQYEQISYMYPANWSVKNQSVASPQSQDDCVYPGSDQITLTSPTNEQVMLQTGIDCIGDAGAQAFGAIPITSLGQSLYLALENYDIDGSPSPSSPQFACLAQSSTPTTPNDLSSKNIFESGDSGAPPANSFCYYPYDSTTVGANGPTESVSSIENSTDFAAAKLIFESMKYEQ